MAHSTGSKLAVLIDADNAQPSKAAPLLAEVAKYGHAHVKRAYGDWAGSGLKGWKEQLLKHAIQPIQQFAYTQGKNSTDMAMIIDAMDLLYSGKFDGFCLVSSDSDFTRLAVRIRESGLSVYGFGSRTTPKPFVVACDRFVYVENFADPEKHAARSEGGVVPPQKCAAPVAEVGKDSRVVRQLETAVEEASDDDGWAALCDVGNLIIKRQPDFDPRTFGYSKLSALVRAIRSFELTQRSPANGKQDGFYVRVNR
ncbi:NYN domain, limkain-b1-type [Coniochaeta hoffmannii]|uniref:NYN domain, limkain-b1-type n=1 Tax=Coniochaeta hoffmannii TaxID=91930 RepID=A0AA38VJV5_9PEZI|nr:NYN domain, limkain-b1-type [Coniochaeta hoffmannii]